MPRAFLARRLLSPALALFLARCRIGCSVVISIISVAVVIIGIEEIEIVEAIQDVRAAAALFGKGRCTAHEKIAQCYVMIGSINADGAQHCENEGANTDTKTAASH